MTYGPRESLFHDTSGIMAIQEEKEKNGGPFRTTLDEFANDCLKELESRRKSGKAKGKEGRVFHSMDDINEAFFPKNFLYDLEQKLCEHLGLTEHYQHRCSPNESDPRMGFIEVAIPRHYYETEDDGVLLVMQQHYRTRGYTVKVTPNYTTGKRKKSSTDEKQLSFTATKGKDAYFISLIPGESSYSVWITESPMERIMKILDEGTGKDERKSKKKFKRAR